MIQTPLPQKIILLFLFLTIISLSVSAATSDIKFSFAVISDTPNGDCTTTQGDALIKSVDFLNEKNPAFIIGLGDLIAGECTSSPASAQLNEFNTQFLQKIKSPFVPVAGNHDFLTSSSKTAWTTFWSNNPNKLLPAYNSRTTCGQEASRFEYNGLGFVLIDPYNLENKYPLSNSELSCLDQLVSSGDLVFRHVTPYGISCRKETPSNCGTSVLGDGGDVKEIEQLTEKLKNKNVKILFSGHTHAYYHGICNGLEFVNTGTLGSRALEFVNGWQSKDTTAVFALVDVYNNGDIKTTFYTYDSTSKTFKPQTKQFPSTVTSKRIANSEKNDNEGVKAICTSIQPSAPEDDYYTEDQEVESMEEVTPQITPSKESSAAKIDPATKSIQDKPSIYTCLNAQTCKELDQVWALKISTYVGNNINQIWDIRTSPAQWKNFAEVYEPTPAKSTIQSLPKYSGTGKCFSQAQSTSQSEADSKISTFNFQGNNIKENKVIIPLLKKIDQEITAKNLNYKIKIGSTYNWRCINSPKVTIVEQITCVNNKGIVQRSKHSYGLAIDINPSTNPFCQTCPQGMCYKNKAGQLVECTKYNSNNGNYYEMPDKIIEIFKANDFSWGGDWSGAKDYMHFEWQGNLGDFKGSGNIEPCAIK